MYLLKSLGLIDFYYNKKQLYENTFEEIIAKKNDAFFFF